VVLSFKLSSVSWERLGEFVYQPLKPGTEKDKKKEKNDLRGWGFL
jgi:hypothetical protein